MNRKFHKLGFQTPRGIQWSDGRSVGLNRGVQLHLLSQNFSYRIAEVKSSSDDGGEAAFRITGSDADRERLNILLGTFRRSNDSNVERSFLAMVDQVAQTLVASSQVSYEIIPSVDADGAYMLRYINSRGLFRLGFGCLQVVPKGAVFQGDSRWAWIPRRCVTEISMPPALGGKRSHQVRLWLLGKYGGYLPKFVENAPSQIAAEIERGFEYKVAQKQGFELQMAATRTLGGIPTSKASSITEAYLVYRLATARWAKAILRDHILDWLKHLCEDLRIEVQFDVAAFITPQEILAKRDAALKGDCSFADALPKTL